MRFLRLILFSKICDNLAIVIHTYCRAFSTVFPMLNVCNSKSINYDCYVNSEPQILDECDIDDNTKEVLLADIKRRLTPQAVKIRTG